MAAVAISPGSAPADARLGAAGRRPIALLASSAIVFTIIVVLGASGGVRGSDQYWYLADTETLLRGEAPFTNCLFPRQLLIQGTERSPFLHDILPQHAVVPIARVVGPYWGWIVMNLAAMLLGAWLTFVAARRVVTPIAAATAASALLLLPTSVFSASQVLAEASIVPLVAGAILLLGRPGGMVKYGLLALLLSLAFMSRFTMVAFLLLLPLVPLGESAPLGRRIALSAWTALLAAVGVWANGRLFAGIPLPGNPFALAINGNGMDIWMTTEPVELSAGSVIAKLELFGRSLADGTVATHLFTATNGAVMLVAAVGAIVAWRRSRRLVAVTAIAALGVDLATLALYQNQPRFVLPTYPALLLAAAFLLEPRGTERQGSGRVALPIVTGLLALASTAVAWQSRGQGMRDAAERAGLEALAARLQGDGDVIHAHGNDQMVGYAFRPRRVLFVSERQAAEDWARIAADPRWRWISCPEQDLDRLRSLGIDGTIVAEARRHGTRIMLLDRGTAPTIAP